MDRTALPGLDDPSLLRTQCFIDGTWTGDPADPVTDPATGEVLGHVPRLGASEATRAVDAAAAAFGGWSRLTAGMRAAKLKSWCALILDNRHDLARILTTEQGKPFDEALAEVDYAASFVEFYAEEARRVVGELIPTHRNDARISVLKQPIGFVAAITPWNFPAAMITRKAAPALAAGCTVVLKPAPETPLTALALAALAERADLPRGVLNVVTGDAPAIGGVLTSHEAVRFVGFTGSTATGQLLMRQAASTVKKVGLELGGNAAFIVFDDANLDVAVEGAVAAKYRNAGQTCICANRIFVQDGIHDAFVEALVHRVQRLRVGHGLEPGVAQGPLINAGAVAKVEQHVDDAVAKGARLLVGGRRHPLGGTFYEPTVLDGVTSDMRIAREETFGPLAPIFRFRDEAEAIALANATEFGLASYLYTRSLGRAHRVSEALECGMVGINTPHLGVAVAPFGGVKQSGLGREGSRHGIEDYLELKYVLTAGLDD